MGQSVAAPVPFHGENSPISTPTEADEEVFEEGEEEDEQEEDPPLQPAEEVQDRVRGMEATEEGATTVVQTSQAQTRAWVSVVDFNGNWRQWHEHEATINAQASDWLEEAAQAAEDWAIMTAVENCVVWRSLKALNLKQREKLLAAICMTFQETVEGNPQRSTVGCPDDFRDWGRRWGTDDDAAQLVMQNQWDNLLHHVMGVTAAMEVWNQNASSPSALGEDSGSGDINMNVTEEGEAAGDQVEAREQDGEEILHIPGRKNKTCRGDHDVHRVGVRSGRCSINSSKSSTERVLTQGV